MKMKITVCAFFTRPNFDMELPLSKIKQQNWKHVFQKELFAFHLVLKGYFLFLYKSHLWQFSQVKAHLNVKDGNQQLREK